MTEKYLSEAFANEIQSAFGVPEIRPEFVKGLYTDLRLHAETQIRTRRPGLHLRPAWIVTLTILALLLIGTLIIGPQQVYAEFAKLLGYIPGVGIVDKSSPIRVLAEPVSVTRDGITITVTSATLTADRTQVVYRIFGLPAADYPTQENIVGCLPGEYLRLADGTKLTMINGGYQPVPAQADSAEFIIPCITNTVPGKAPENWEFPLHFVLAPADLTVMPVIELTPSVQVTSTPGVTTTSSASTQVDQAVTVSKEIPTTDGYILIGNFEPQTAPGQFFQQTGMMKIRDASGKTVSYTYPQDVSDEIDSGWGAQFKAAGLTYPLTITFSGVMLQSADPSTSAQLIFDAGTDPQPGQVWNLNQEIQVAGHTLTLVSVTADSRNGYSFDFKVDPSVYSVGLQIDGFTPDGGGGGGGGGLTEGRFDTSLSYSQLPTGQLTLIVSNLTLIGDSRTWQGQWTPATTRTDLPANPTAQPGLCLTQDTLAQLQPAPSSLLIGSALFYEPLLNSDKWGLVFYHLDGSDRQILVSDAGDGVFSPDGNQMVYPATDGLHILNIQTKDEKILANTHGFSPRWSPDGKEIAFVALDQNNIDSVFVINTDGTGLQQISDLNYESIIGWSANGKQLYFVVPYTGGAAWKVLAYDLSNHQSKELFTIENGTPKFLNPQLSPDGQWIAYRGQDNSSLYLVHPDGSDMHLVAENTGVVGIAWSTAGWLGLSMGTNSSQDTTVVLLKPDTCETYLLPNLHGQLQGVNLLK
jgi:Periplasmic component of the Tol biopolymer transport system